MPKKGEKMSAEQKAKIAEKRKKKADLIKMHTRMYPIHLARIRELEKEVDELKKKVKAGSRDRVRVLSLEETYGRKMRIIAKLKTKHTKLKREIIKRYGALPDDPIHGAHRRIGEKINDITDEVRRQKARGVLISKGINRRANRPDPSQPHIPTGRRPFMGHDNIYQEERAIWLDPRDRHDEGLYQYDALDQQLRVRQQKTMVSNFMAGKAIKPASTGFVPKVAAGAAIDFTNPGLRPHADGTAEITEGGHVDYRYSDY